MVLSAELENGGRDAPFLTKFAFHKQSFTKYFMQI
jgi:hypothetical protein